MGCREEFPHLQQVLEKYRPRGFEVLAINLEPAQRQSALALLGAMQVGFVPVQSEWAWAEKHYGVQGTPFNALVDTEGRIVFNPDVHDDASQIVLERQVAALLDRARRR